MQITTYPEVFGFNEYFTRHPNKWPSVNLACYKLLCLIHLPLDKMAAISLTIFSHSFSRMKSFVFFIRISMKFVPKGPVVNDAALVELMARRRIGDKPFSQPMLTRFTDAYYIRGTRGEMSFNYCYSGELHQWPNCLQNCTPNPYFLLWLDKCSSPVNLLLLTEIG